MTEFAIRIGGTVAVTLIVKGVASLLSLSMPWWLAALIAIALVFGGWLIVVIGEDL